MMDRNGIAPEPPIDEEEGTPGGSTRADTTQVDTAYHRRRSRRSSKGMQKAKSLHPTDRNGSRVGQSAKQVDDTQSLTLTSDLEEGEVEKTAQYKQRAIRSFKPVLFFMAAPYIAAIFASGYFSNYIVHLVPLITALVSCFAMMLVSNYMSCKKSSQQGDRAQEENDYTGCCKFNCCNCIRMIAYGNLQDNMLLDAILPIVRYATKQYAPKDKKKRNLFLLYLQEGDIATDEIAWYCPLLWQGSHSITRLLFSWVSLGVAFTLTSLVQPKPFGAEGLSGESPAPLSRIFAFTVLLQLVAVLLLTIAGSVFPSHGYRNDVYAKLDMLRSADSIAFSLRKFIAQYDMKHFFSLTEIYDKSNAMKTQNICLWFRVFFFPVAFTVSHIVTVLKARDSGIGGDFAKAAFALVCFFCTLANSLAMLAIETFFVRDLRLFLSICTSRMKLLSNMLVDNLLAAVIQHIHDKHNKVDGEELRKTLQKTLDWPSRSEAPREVVIRHWMHRKKAKLNIPSKIPTCRDLQAWSVCRKFVLEYDCTLPMMQLHLVFAGLLLVFIASSVSIVVFYFVYHRQLQPSQFLERRALDLYVGFAGTLHVTGSLMLLLLESQFDFSKSADRQLRLFRQMRHDTLMEEKRGEWGEETKPLYHDDSKAGRVNSEIADSFRTLVEEETRLPLLLGLKVVDERVFQLLRGYTLSFLGTIIGAVIFRMLAFIPGIQ